ncbi:TPA: hypothetical protein QDB04_000151 [Burkholderia vietnamiensis]|nr:hypothetical protein [Burkholderia vietnamiensis]
MSLPSIPFLKDQANRLVAYLGDKHRFRLRAASALEAVAAMYGKPDWNTLQALSEREELPRPEAASVSLLAESRYYPLTWTPRGVPDFKVETNDWFRHTLAVGGSLESRREWVLQHIVAQVERGWPGVFLNAFGEKMPADVRDALLTDGMLLELPEESEGPLLSSFQGAPFHADLFGRAPKPQPYEVDSPALNLMADMEPEEIASMLVGVLLRAGESPGTDYYMQHANYVLTIVLHAMRAAGMAVSMRSLMDVFADGKLDNLHRLAKSLDPDSEAGKQMALFLEFYENKGNGVREKAWYTHFSVVMHALRRLNAARWPHLLFSENPGANGLFSLLQKGACLVIESPEKSDGQAEKAVTSALRSALSRRLMLPREEKQQGWIFSFGELDQYISPSLARMAERARSGRVALLTTTKNETLIPTDLRANIWNRVYLSGCPREALLDWVREMESRPVLVQPGRITA